MCPGSDSNMILFHQQKSVERRAFLLIRRFIFQASPGLNSLFSSEICGGQVPILRVKNMWKILETVPWHRVVLECEENSPFVKSRCEHPWKWKFLLGNFLQKQLTTKQRIPCSCCCSCCRLRYCYGTFTNTTWSNVWLKSIDPTSPW